jgi:saccharopine dehydrogenase (NADP+, L-glutamate forming)
MLYTHSLIYALLGVIKDRGVLAPLTPEITKPIIEALEKEGIGMVEAIL